MTDSMRDTLEATFKEIEERAEQPEEEVKDEVVEEKEEEAPEKEEEDTKSPEPEAPQAKAPEKPQDTKDQQAPPEKPKAPEKRDTSLANPPVTWTAKAKAQWAAIPEDVKREIRKREQDALNGITQYKEKAAFGERLDRTIQPYQAYLKSRGTSPERAIEDALNLSYTLATVSPKERGAILKGIAQQYGGADFSDPNPEQDKANQALQPLVNEINQLKQALAAQRDTEQQRQTQTLEQQVTSFAAETDETGAYKHPYFEEVKGLMAALLESGQAKQLGDAYALAVKAHPEISVLVQSEQTLKTKQQEEARAEKARRNNQVNFQRKPTSPMKNTAPHGSMRETIEATYNGLVQSA